MKDQQLNRKEIPDHLPRPRIKPILLLVVSHSGRIRKLVVLFTLSADSFTNVSKEGIKKDSWAVFFIIQSFNYLNSCMVYFCSIGVGTASPVEGSYILP